MQSDENRSRGGFQDNPQNINIDGRPKKEQSLTEIILQKFSKEDMADLVISQLKAKDPATIRFFYDHIDGKALQKTLIGGMDEQPMRLILVEDDDESDGVAENETRTEGPGTNDADDTQD